MWDPKKCINEQKTLGSDFKNLCSITFQLTSQICDGYVSQNIEFEVAACQYSLTMGCIFN